MDCLPLLLCLLKLIVEPEQVTFVSEVLPLSESVCGRPLITHVPDDELVVESVLVGVPTALRR